jgi:hypothetical protein|tara:strand:- start:5436 stop:7361 length:1926 start_codon:yes stop_codon:yes gene_type:complete
MPRIASTNTVSNPKRLGYDVQIDNMLLRSAIGPGREMTIQSSDVREGQINVKQNAEDFTSNLGRIYSRNNFSGGSNLDTAHRSNGKPNDNTRYWDSQSIDVFHNDLGKAYNIQLLHTTEKEQTLTSAVSHMAVVGTRIYVSDDETLYKSDDGGDNWSTVSEGLTAGYQIKGLAAHGDLLYITANNGSAGEIESLTSGGTSTQKMSAAVYDKIFSVKGQLIVSIGNALHPYDGNTTVGSAIVTLPSGQTFTDATDAGAVVLVTATDGRIYSLKDISGTLTLKGQTEISGEQPTCIVESQGIIFYGTKEVQTGTKVIGRLYRASLTVADDLYVLGQNQLIKQWDADSIDNSPNNLFTTRDSVYTGIKESASTSFLWRYYLPTAGIARYYKASAGGTINNIVNVNEKFLFTVSSDGVYQQTSTFESEGFLILSAADFFTAESKQFVGAEVSTFTLASNTSVDLEYSTKFEALDNPNDASFKKAFTQVGGVGDTEQQIEEVSRYIVGKVVLKTSDGVSTPKLKSVQFRALARPELVVAQIPINISDRVERPGRKPIKVKGLGNALYSALRDIEGDSVTVEIFSPQEIIKGVVERISYPINANVERGSVMEYAIITVRGTRQASLDDVTSIQIFGINALGQVRFGA